MAWYVAEKNGYFKKYGAKVKLVWFANYTDSISALPARRLDANSQTWADTMAPLSKNVPVTTILVNYNSDGNDAQMVNPASKSFADLLDRSIRSFGVFRRPNRMNSGGRAGFYARLSRFQTPPALTIYWVVRQIAPAKLNPNWG